MHGHLGEGGGHVGVRANAGVGDDVSQKIAVGTRAPSLAFEGVYIVCDRM